MTFPRNFVCNLTRNLSTCKWKTSFYMFYTFELMIHFLAEEHVELHVVSRYIGLINLLLKLCFFVFRVYLSSLNCSGVNISFFYSLLIKLLLLPFFNIGYGAILSASFVSLLIIWNTFATLFCCYHLWLSKINAPGSVNSSKLILFCYL